MRSRLWQIAILSLVAFSIINYGLMFPNLASSGTFGLRLQSGTAREGVAIVRTVSAGLPAARAGIRPGDRLEFTSRMDTLIALFSTDVGDRITVRDGARTIELVAVPDPTPVPYQELILFSITKFAFVAMAALIIVRRPSDGAAQALALFLAAFGAGVVNFTSMIPTTTGRFSMLLLTQVLYMGGIVSFYAFTTLFPRRAMHGFRRWMLRALPLVASMGLLAAIVSICSGFLFSISALFDLLSVYAYIGIYVLAIALAIVSLIISYRESRDAERARMRWLTGIFTVGFSGLLLLFVSYLTPQANDAMQYFALTIVVIPLGLSYVILRHRVLDITFVVNRAVVYTSVSLIIVGAFIVFEWLISHIVVENSQTSVVLQLGGALALGLSTRYIHGKVDRFIDDLFFRDRHVAEETIRRFAHEAALITDADVLVRRTVEVARRNARIDFAAFYVRDETSYRPAFTSSDIAPAVDENDEAILAMRAWHEPVHISTASSALPGEYVFPMMVRGTLAGFLLCGGKLTHEALAPDERDALRVLARDAGIALDSLRVAGIESELARLSALLAERHGAQPAGVPLRSSQ